MNQYFLSYARKTVVALVAALGVLAIAMADNVVTSSEWLQVLVAFLGAFGVYYMPNRISTDQVRDNH